VIVWACSTGNRLSRLIVCNEGGIGADEYEDIIYDGLFSLMDDVLKLPEQPGTTQIMDKTTFLFMQDNALCHKSTCILEFLAENAFP